ncbi:hypothetical protein LOB94_09025 [Lactobacillus delbrueckii subsp. bulgaricus]|uniref:hypothetical protein n=1 Tax=Lactobacillus delbrueckii TaxID=1584 RepID=UPI001E4E6EB4|nr:hypothetical protein [Lactobacillus delbrueckii]MCD5483402.1 hypothetical protein [Lactobacillus delbrueckii subsp. bulgaricus]
MTKGFWIMLLSGLIGLALVIYAFKKDLPKGKKIAFWLIGAALLVFAVALALPNGLQL